MNTAQLHAGVLFDLDGTLLDTNYLQALAWSRAFRESGEWAPMNAIHRLIGMGGDQLVPQLLGHESPEATAARPRHYRALMDDVRPFPDAARLLRRLHDEGLTVVLATSAPRDELAVLLEVLDAGDAIDAQTTADDVSSSKPDPEIFQIAMRRASIDAERAIAIGDSIWDVRSARAAGLACVTVESGGFSHHELSEDGSVRVYQDTAELLAQFRTSPLATLV